MACPVSPIRPIRPICPICPICHICVLSGSPSPPKQIPLPFWGKGISENSVRRQRPAKSRYILPTKSMPRGAFPPDVRLSHAEALGATTQLLGRRSASRGRCRSASRGRSRSASRGRSRSASRGGCRSATSRSRRLRHLRGLGRLAGLRGLCGLRHGRLWLSDRGLRRFANLRRDRRGFRCFLRGRWGFPAATSKEQHNSAQH